MSESEKREEELVNATAEEEETESGTETAAPEIQEAAEEEKVESAPAAEEKEEGEPEEEEIEVVEEKIYTIPLRHVWVVTPRGKRAPRAVRDVRDFVSRHMKSEEVVVSNEVNEAIWSRGINKPPRKVSVRAVKDKEGKVIVYPAKTA
jgi:large subunit ribosomal protein L31e